MILTHSLGTVECAGPVLFSVTNPIYIFSQLQLFYHMWQIFVQFSEIFTPRKCVQLRLLYYFGSILVGKMLFFGQILPGVLAPALPGLQLHLLDLLLRVGHLAPQLSSRRVDVSTSYLHGYLLKYVEQLYTWRSRYISDRFLDSL